MRTSGDVTAATTPATTTGTTIVLVSAATHVAPMSTAPTPASSHDANPRSLSHCGAEKTPESSTDSSSTTSGSSPGSEPGARVRWMRLVSRGDIGFVQSPRGASSRAVRRSENGATGAPSRRAAASGRRRSPSPRPNRVTRGLRAEEPRADVSAGGGDLVQLASRLVAAMSYGSSVDTANPLVRSALPIDEDAPHEVVGRRLQRRAVAVRDRAEVQPHAGPVLGDDEGGTIARHGGGGYPATARACARFTRSG